MAIHSLFRLAKHLDNPEFHDKGLETLKLYFHQLEVMPSGSGQLLCELAFLLSAPKEIAIIGKKEDAKTGAMLAALHGLYLPNKIVALSEPNDAVLPLLANKPQIDDSTTAYVCENYVCQAPTTDVEEFVEMLNRQL